MWSTVVLFVVFGAGLGSGVWVAERAHKIPAKVPEKGSPHTYGPNEEGANKEEEANESYGHKVIKADILPVWLGVAITLGASVIALFALRDLRQQGAALKRQNDMIVSKERARLRVDLIDLPKEPEDFPATLFVKGKVTISGSTEAAIRKGFMEIFKRPDGFGGPFPLDSREMRSIPSVIRAIDSPVDILDFVLDFKGTNDVYKGSSVVYTKGAIHYTDVFGGKWVFRFFKKYEFMFYESGDVLGGNWVSQGGEKDNGEYPDD